MLMNHHYPLLLQLIYLSLATPILHDFYNYDIEKPQFVPAFSEFVQVRFRHDLPSALNGSPILEHYWPQL